MLKRNVNLIYVISIIIAVLIICISANSANNVKAAEKSNVLNDRIIILDAGHGIGNTNIYAGYDEGVAMLKLALKIKPVLESYGATVYMTRTDAYDVSHPIRAALMNKWALQEVKKYREAKLSTNLPQSEMNAIQSDIAEINRLLNIIQSVIDDPAKNAPIYLNYPFDYTYNGKIHADWKKVFEYENDPSVRDRFLMISLHSNSTATPIDTSVHGAMAFYVSNDLKENVSYYTNYSNEQRSRDFGEKILDSINKLGISKRRTAADCYLVIREHNLPAVLVENGFHTNANDRAKISDDSFLDKLALAYADTIVDYFSNIELPQYPQYIDYGQQYPETTTIEPDYGQQTETTAIEPDYGQSTETTAPTMAEYEQSTETIPVISDGLGIDETAVSGSVNQEVSDISTNQYFSDVTENHWAYEYINELRTLGITDGIGNNSFGLGQTITRAEFAAFMCKLMNWKFENNGDGSFEDNKDLYAWYFGFVETALYYGAISASEHYFYPDMPITREDMAVMIVRTLGYGELNEQPESLETPFPDVHDNIEYITVAKDLGIITGISDEQFAPADTATREQAAAMLVRMYRVLENEPEFNLISEYEAVQSQTTESD